MAQEVKGEKFSDLNKNPVDNALFLYSSDIVSPEEGAKLYLEGFRVKALENEKEVPFESISIMVPSDRGEEYIRFETLKEANAFLRDMAEVAPPIKDGADRLLMHAEWDNQDNLPENGFTEYYRYLYLTREMNKSPNIIERSIVVRNMFDAGFLRPNGMPDNEWEEKKTMVGKYPKDKEALVSSLCRLEGVNKVFQKIVRNHKLENMKQRSSAAKSLRIGKPKKMNVGKEMSDMENVR